jgi:hypothetical protein
MAVEVCWECDIAGCHHIRERQAKSGGTVYHKIPSLPPESPTDLVAALSEAQATIARLEAVLREARAWIDDWPDPRYGTTEDGEWRKQVLAQIDAELSPREGEGT